MASIEPIPPHRPQPQPSDSKTITCAKNLKREVSGLIDLLHNLTPSAANNPEYLHKFAEHVMATAGFCEEAKNA